MENLLKLLKILEEYEVKGIYWNDELEDFKELMKAFASMDIEKVAQEQDLNIFYLLLSSGVWHKVGVYSLDELDEEVI